VVCLLNPDSDISRYPAVDARDRRHSDWARYHTDPWTADVDGVTLGVVGMPVRAPFAVLVAEQFAASGARLVISIAVIAIRRLVGSLSRYSELTTREVEATNGPKAAATSDSTSSPDPEPPRSPAARRPTRPTPKNHSPSPPDKTRNYATTPIHGLDPIDLTLPGRKRSPIRMRPSVAAAGRTPNSQRGWPLVTPG